MTPHRSPVRLECARAGDECWACAMGPSGRPPAHVPASMCWHYAIPGLNACYPLCDACAMRWRSYRDPGRLHTI